MSISIAKLTRANFKFGLCYCLSFLLSFAANKIFITSSSSTTGEVWKVYLVIQGISSLSVNVLPYYVMADRKRYMQLCDALKSVRAVAIYAAWLATCYLIYSIDNIILIVTVLGLLSGATACISSYWIANKSIFAFNILSSSLPLSVLVSLLLGNLLSEPNNIGTFAASYLSFCFLYSASVVSAQKKRKHLKQGSTQNEVDLTLRKTDSLRILISEAYIPALFITTPAVLLLRYTALSGSNAAAVISTCMTAVSISILLTSGSGHFINTHASATGLKVSYTSFSFGGLLRLYGFVSACCALAYLWLAPPLYGFSLTRGVAWELIVLLSTGIPISCINIVRSDFNKALNRRWKVITLFYTCLAFSSCIISIANKGTIIVVYATVVWLALLLVFGLLRREESNRGKAEVYTVSSGCAQ